MKTKTRQTINKALDILELFLKREGEIGLVELSNLSGLNVSTVHRITSTLVKRGYINQRKERGKYSLGLRFLEFSRMVKTRMKIGDVALPFLEDLNKVVNESVNLAILDSNEAIYIEHIESYHDLRMFTQVGNRVSLHCTGVGKVFLAHMTEEDLEGFLTSKGLPYYTENTITDFSKLKEELLTVKREGVALDNEEKELGVRCVASPVKDFNGNVVAAISVSGPRSRLSANRVEEIKSLVKNYGLEVSRAMGYKGE